MAFSSREGKKISQRVNTENTLGNEENPTRLEKILFTCFFNNIFFT